MQALLKCQIKNSGEYLDHFPFGDKTYIRAMLSEQIYRKQRPLAHEACFHMG